MGSPRDFQNMLDYLEMTEIRPRIHHIYPFNEVIKALKDLESGNQIGKLVVKMHD